jgi:hypothetical protein
MVRWVDHILSINVFVELLYFYDASPYTTKIRGMLVKIVYLGNNTLLWRVSHKESYV